MPNLHPDRATIGFSHHVVRSNTVLHRTPPPPYPVRIRLAVRAVSPVSFAVRLQARRRDEKRRAKDREGVSPSAMSIDYKINDETLLAAQFLDLAQRVWPGDYEEELVQTALSRTLNITAWVSGDLIGCVRLLSDGYFMSTISEIMVDPQYQGQGIGRHLMELAWAQSPTSIFLGAQPGREGFFERLGYQRSLASFAKGKERRKRFHPAT
jgi:GNAT superfamily N-acetyltransferase